MSSIASRMNFSFTPTLTAWASCVRHFPATPSSVLIQQYAADLLASNVNNLPFSKFSIITWIYPASVKQFSVTNRQTFTNKLASSTCLERLKLAGPLKVDLFPPKSSGNILGTRRGSSLKAVQTILPISLLDTFFATAVGKSVIHYSLTIFFYRGLPSLLDPASVLIFTSPDEYFTHFCSTSKSTSSE